MFLVFYQYLIILVFAVKSQQPHFVSLNKLELVLHDIESHSNSYIKNLSSHLML
jgi:hypothetical protein